MNQQGKKREQNVKTMKNKVPGLVPDLMKLNLQQLQSVFSTKERALSISQLLWNETLVAPKSSSFTHLSQNMISIFSYCAHHLLCVGWWFFFLFLVKLAILLINLTFLIPSTGGVPTHLLRLEYRSDLQSNLNSTNSPNTKVEVNLWNINNLTRYLISFPSWNGSAAAAV